MGQDTQQLREEIASRREDLGYTVDAIEDRVSPSKIVQRRKNAVRQSFSNLSEKVMGNVEHAKGATAGAITDMKDNAQNKVGSVNDAVHGAEDMAVNRTQGSPLLAGAIVAGIGFLASVAFPSTKAEANAVHDLANKAQPLIDQAKSEGAEIASSMREKGMESAGQLKQSATEHAQDVATSSQETVNDAKGTAQQKGQEVAEDAKSRKPGN